MVYAAVQQMLQLSGKTRKRILLWFRTHWTRYVRDTQFCSITAAKGRCDGSGGGMEMGVGRKRWNWMGWK